MEIKKDIRSTSIDPLQDVQPSRPDVSVPSESTSLGVGNPADSIETYQRTTQIDETSVIGSRTVSPEDEKTVRTFYEEGWNKGDAKVFSKHSQIAERCRLQMEQYRQLFSDLKITVNTLEKQDAEILVRWTARGTLTNATGASPVQEEVDGLTKMRIENGEITSAKAVWNDRDLQNRIGQKHGG